MFSLIQAQMLPTMKLNKHETKYTSTEKERNLKNILKKNCIIKLSPVLSSQKQMSEKKKIF